MIATSIGIITSFLHLFYVHNRKHRDCNFLGLHENGVLLEVTGI